TVRLVYADWLDEHEQADRAEFIRTQIALARIDEVDPRIGELRRRERELLEAHREEWERPLRKLWVRGDILFHRGFADHIGMESADFLKNAEQLFALAPITSVSLHDLRGEYLGDLAQSPYLTSLTALDLSGNCIGEAGARALAGSPHLANIRALDLSGN